MKNRQRRHWRPLLALAVAVLAAHAVLLRALPERILPRQADRPVAFVTRSLDLRAPGPVAAPAHEPKSATPSQAAQGSPTAARRAARPAAPDRASEVAMLAPAASVAPGAAGPAVAEQALTLTAGESAPAGPRQNAATARSFAIPGSMRLHYRVDAQVRGVDLRASGDLDWHHDGGSYEAQLQVRAFLVLGRTQRSTGQITAEGLAPTRFSDKTRSEEATHFERDKGKLVFSSNRPDAPLLPGAQDRLSVLLQLGAMIGGEPRRYPPGTEIGIQTASTREAETWLFTVEGEEELALPGGRLKAVRVIRNPRKEFDQKVEVWLAPALDYMPVRVRLTQQNGDFVDQQWSSTDRQ